MIRLLDLIKKYGNFNAVDKINLEIREGIVFGFLGPNGAGKTTTIRMMAGLMKPTSGRIIINGMDLARHPAEVKQCIGFIPDRPFLYEKLTGREFLRLIAGLYKLNHSENSERRIDELLDIFELRHWDDELIESYSHGMKQRLTMCAALLHAPKVLIVDEPMVGLDPKGARLVKNIFAAEAHKGTTVFMSTHSLDVAQEACQEIAIIQGGKILAKGTSDELKNLAGVEGNLENIFLKLTEKGQTAHESPLSAA